MSAQTGARSRGHNHRSTEEPVNAGSRGATGPAAFGTFAATITAAQRVIMGPAQPVRGGRLLSLEGHVGFRSG